MTSIRRGWRLAMSPLSWRIGTRRLFLIFLPISLPLWVGWVFALGAATIVRDLLRPAITFWHAPPQVLRGDRYYRHSRKPKLVIVAERHAA